MKRREPVVESGVPAAVERFDFARWNDLPAEATEEFVLRWQHSRGTGRGSLRSEWEQHRGVHAFQRWVRARRAWIARNTKASTR